MSMRGKPLSAEAIAALLGPKKPASPFVRDDLPADHILLRKGSELEKARWRKGFNLDFGFEKLSGKYITYHDTDQRLRCTSRGCGTPTTYKVRGMSKCSIHALIELGRILDEKDGVRMATLAASPEEPEIGSQITITATGFNDSDDLSITIKNPDGDEEEFTGTTDGSGEYIFTDVVSVEQPGTIRIHAVDAADTTADLDIEVSS